MQPVRPQSPRGEVKAGEEADVLMDIEGEWMKEILVGDTEDQDFEAAPQAEDDALFGEAREGEAGGAIETIDDVESEEDMAPKRVSPDPGMPTQSEIDEHDVDHTPYRCWCEACVEGRGVGEQHRMHGDSGSIPILAFDYLFVTAEDIYRREEVDDKKMQRVILKILVAKDRGGTAERRRSRGIRGRATGGGHEMAGLHPY